MLLDKNQILTAFDNLVDRQVIVFGPETVTIIKDKVLQYEVRICPALGSKPRTIGATEDGDFAQSPKYGPGSDLADADPELIISKILDTHLLVLNRFAVFRPQYLIITLDSFRRQTENLDESDLMAAWTVLQGLPDEHFVIFNCGNEAGCSRMHKHMQVIPCSAGFQLFPDQDGLDPAQVPFKHFIHRFGPATDDVSGSLLANYQSLSRDAVQAWRSCTGQELGYFPHNMMLTKRWMMVVPRRRSVAHGASANAAGMMGMVWVMNQQQADRWTDYGPDRVLEELGVPNRPSQGAL